MEDQVGTLAVKPRPSQFDSARLNAAESTALALTGHDLDGSDPSLALGRPSRPTGWLRSPWFDLLLLANVGWVLLFLPGFSGSGGTVVDFWQLYYITLPHRWITLVLVVVDSDRRQGRTGTLGVVAGLIAVVVSLAYGISGAFLCLGMIDYLWNAWHFASQHGGVLRIYSRKSKSGIAWFEKWGVRTFVIYTIVRAAGSLVWPAEQLTQLQPLLSILDWIILAIPLALLAQMFGAWTPNQWPKLIYLLSFLGLYVGYLLAAHFESSRWIVCFAAAASTYHAVEYLAIVTHYAEGRKDKGSAGLMRNLSFHWSFVLAIFIIGLGTFGWWATHNATLVIAWQGINLWAAFTHYAFDGMIWKLRESNTARALGAV